MGDVLKDDNFLDVTIMTINAKKIVEEYRKIIQYLNGMRFPIGAIKAVRTQIIQKSQNYLIIGDQLYFQIRDGVCDEPLERVKLHVFYMNFMMSYVEVTLRNK